MYGSKTFPLRVLLLRFMKGKNGANRYSLLGNSNFKVKISCHKTVNCRLYSCHIPCHTDMSQ